MCGPSWTYVWCAMWRHHRGLTLSVHPSCFFVTSPWPMALGKPSTAEHRHGVIAKTWRFMNLQITRCGSWICSNYLFHELSKPRYGFWTCKLTVFSMHLHWHDLAFELAKWLTGFWTSKVTIWFLNLQSYSLVEELSKSLYGFWNFKVTI